MATSQPRFWLPIIRFSIFFILFYLYIWLRIDPGLFYHGHGMIPFPVFYLGADFFKGFLGYPAGLIEYVSAFLSQFYYFPALGSLIITAVAVLICLITGQFIAAMGSTRFRAVIFVPAILLLMVYNRYFHGIDIGLGLLVSLFFTWIYLLTARQRAIFRSVVFLVSSVILYYTAGGAFLLYAALCTIFEFLTKREPLVGLSYILFALFIPYAAGIYIFKVGITEAYMRILPFHPESYSRPSTAAWTLYIFFPVAALWIALWRPFAAALGWRPATESLAESGKEKSSPGINSPDYYRINKRKFLYESLVLLLIAGTAVLLPFERNIKTSLRINSFARREMWPQVLEEAPRLAREKHSILINHDVNNALYYTGRLPYDMFSYPQTYPQSLKALFTLNFGFGSLANEFSNAELPRISDTFFRLGLVNVAELAAFVALELIECPAIVRQLFVIHIVKGNKEAARVCLNALSRDLIFGKWAQRQLSRLESDPLMSNDELVQYTRSVMPVSDYVEQFTVENLLLDLLHHNKQNRMAFEYLMAYYLFSYKFDRIAQNISRLDDFDYPDIPLLYEEAILIHINETGEEVDMHGRKISDDTVQRFRRFCNLANLYSQNSPEAFDILVKDFGNSYFFYCLFGYSGLIK